MRVKSIKFPSVGNMGVEETAEKENTEIRTTTNLFRVLHNPEVSQGVRHIPECQALRILALLALYILENPLLGTTRE